MRLRQLSVVRIVLAAAPIVACNIAVITLAGAGPLSTLVRAASSLALYAGYVRLIERRPLDELARTRAVPEFARGLALGAALFSVTIAILCLLGVCTVEAAGDVASTANVLAGAIAAAVIEELLLRAIFFRLVERSLGTWIALALSAALFGVLHAFNVGATVVSTIAIALEAGVLLAAAFALTRRLWLPFGLHAAWNFTEGGIFGASISGGQPRGLLTSQLSGPELLTGGSFGPEASVVAVVVCLAAGITLLALAHRRGQFLPPRWRRPA
ncbi:MAG TPA: CPBP family intramembrane glutamic endopeptidase [Kofleriaceae bacterium]|jgi:hypothetical protein|nr:CPBP family intramembrane glutamic endopeptidase [Kofleriaceae bacterium]